MLSRDSGEILVVSPAGYHIGRAAVHVQPKEHPAKCGLSVRYNLGPVDLDRERVFRFVVVDGDDAVAIEQEAFKY